MPPIDMHVHLLSGAERNNSTTADELAAHTETVLNTCAFNANDVLVTLFVFTQAERERYRSTHSDEAFYKKDLTYISYFSYNKYV
ncbi:hypothetical protein KDA06_04875 [Candidatus Saccharibacteria bacterium]|jgi:hypothetical protein|nr:hypothetical protein [Candidatus Saccharibacteria bacterium]